MTSCNSYPESHPKHVDNKAAEDLFGPAACMDYDRGDVVKHPAHYTYGTIEAKDYIDSCGFGEGFNLGNAIKYITRCAHKGEKIRDLQKAIQYLQFEIDRERRLSE